MSLYLRAPEADRFEQHRTARGRMTPVLDHLGIQCAADGNNVEAVCHFPE
jgi:hypothetical protein